MTDEDDLQLAAIDQVPFIMAVCEGPELRVLFLSAATRAVLPGRAWSGRPIRDVISDLIGQQITDAYYEVYRTGEPITAREWRVHLDRPDGSIYEMWANFTITPWFVDGERRGVIGIGFDVTEAARERQAAADEAAQLQQAYAESRDVITALQRELLPAGLPVLPGVQIGATYLLAEANTAAGGDWFDAVVRPGGRVALIVGDVVGHGVTASGVMGQLRAVLQERLDAGADIPSALASADRFARRRPAARAATVFLAEFDPATGDVSYCTAGHPPPLVVTAGGETRRLPGTGGTPLGTGGSFPVRTDHLDIGDLLLMFTDGILERPGRTHPQSIAELAHVAADSVAGRVLKDPGANPAERVCAQAVELLARVTGHTDDITLLAAHRVPAVRDLELDLPSVPESLGPSRAAIGAWLDEAGATAEDVFCLQHALGELLTNAIEHGQTDRPVALRVALTQAGSVHATVTDQGHWQEPVRQPLRGRGLALTAELVQSLTVAPSEHGTRATIEHNLTRPAGMLGTIAHPLPPDVEEPLRIVELPGGRENQVRLEGAVDASTADRMLHELMRRSRGGTAGLTVDLSGLTLLSSAGVAALYRVFAVHAEQKAQLGLRAQPGSVAQHVLDVVALPYDAV